MTITKSATLKVVAKGENSWDVLISTGDVDRDRDTIAPMGWKVDSYLKNPIVLWAHDYAGFTPTGGVPVGKTTGLTLTAEGPVATFEFRQPANDADFVNVVRSAWEQGILNAASVGFNPLKWSEREDGGRDYQEQELLEWSIVPVPANAGALRRSYEVALKAAGMGALLEPAIKDAEPDPPATEPPVTADPPTVEPPPAEPEPEPLADDTTEDTTEAQLAQVLSQFISNIREILQ